MAQSSLQDNNGANLASKMKTVNFGTQANGKVAKIVTVKKVKTVEAPPALYGTAKQAIKPVLGEPDSPTKKIRSALKNSPNKARLEKNAFLGGGAAAALETNVHASIILEGTSG